MLLTKPIAAKKSVSDSARVFDPTETRKAIMNPTFNPHEYAIRSGWSWECVEETALFGVSDEDAEGLTGEECDMLLAWCKEQIGEFRALNSDNQENYKLL